MDKIIKRIDFDFSDLPQDGELRNFTVVGSNDAEFRLEIKNEDNYYYNFVTNLFSSGRSDLKGVIKNGSYKTSISFPAITDDDQYDIYLYANPGTKHANYIERRFADGSIDLNSSTGSNSLLVQKVIYQYTDLTLTLSTFSPNSTVGVDSKSDSTITISRNKNKGSLPFTLTCSVNSAASSYQIIRQPNANDLLSFASITVGSAPEDLPGEEVYPTTDSSGVYIPFSGENMVVNGDFTAGTSDKIKIDGYSEYPDGTNGIPTVGDKVIASSTSNKTVDGAVTSGVKVVMDDNVNTIMAVGDRITSTLGGHALDSKNVTVAALNPDGDNVKEFSMSEAVALANNLALDFTPSVDSILTTVIAVNPDGDDPEEIQLSATTGFRDNQSFLVIKARNRQWPVDDISNIVEGAAVLPGTNIVSGTIIAKYEDTITINEGTDKEETIIRNEAPAINTKGQKATVSKGVITAQPGNIVFNNQQLYALNGDTINVASYGQTGVSNVYGYDIKITNLAVSLTSITTTTTAAVSNSTTVPVASVNGVLPGSTTISGIGIDPKVVDPTVESRSVTSGAGNLVLSAAQTLENGATLTINNSGQVATITGNIEIIKAGNSNQTIYFDVENMLSMS